jgi:hypothetical protein
MKTCVVFNIIVKKIKLKHSTLTSQILLECTIGGQIKLGHLKFDLCKSDH